MLYIVTLIKGILIGLMASIPLGPIGILCIQRTLSRGRLSGFVSGLGAATVDTIFAAIAGFGFVIIIDFIEDRSIILQFVGGIIVVLLGIRIFFSHPRKEIRDSSQSTLMKDYITSFLLTLYNPLAIFVFLGIFAGFGLLGNDKGHFFSFILIGGIFAGASLWWITLASLVGYYRKNFGLRNILRLNRIAGVLLTLFGLYYVGYSAWQIFIKTF
jgi:threonine/homoserine/homoserine lactone efflux protein